MREGIEAELMSPPRNAPPGRPMSQSTPTRDRRPVFGPDRHGSTLGSLTDGDRAKLVLEVRKTEQYHRGRNDGSKKYKARITNYSQEGHKSSFIPYRADLGL